MPTAVDVTPFLSERSKRWKPSGIRGLFPLEKRPGMISLLAGKPAPETFPFEAITLKVKPVGDEAPLELTLDGKDLEEALQYGATSGLPRLVKWLEDFQCRVHGRSLDEGWRVSVGSGSQDLMHKTFQNLINEGDSMLVETPVYAGTLGILNVEPCTLIECPTDTQGLNPEALEKILANWETERPGQRFPRLLYTIPTGSNPTGASIPQSRKIEVLKLVKKYNFLILEDDAYAFVHYGEKGSKAKSYFALEKEVNDEVGRVVRFDSFSKVLSSGMRIGFLSAAKEICDKVDLITSNTNLQTASTTQAMVYKLLEHWGQDGFIAHVGRVAEYYRVKRDLFEAAAKKYLTGVAKWNSPVAGMFVYIELLYERDIDSYAVILEKAVERGFLAVPGISFMPAGGPTNHVRISFSLTNGPEAEEACKRLRDTILEVRGDKQPQAA
ncbi:pyridoxal phosphate-dependent transferase [Schizophyllum commune]